MINYIVQVVLFQILFLVVYDLFLQKETFFKWNRIYLLATPVLSFIIPLLKFESVQKFAQQENIIWLPEVMLNPETVIVEQLSNPAATFNLVNWVFYIGLFVSVLIFTLKLTKIIRLILSNKRVKKENYSLILLEDNRSAFSFFKFIFIHKQVLDKDELQIIQHELVHCSQFHTLDLIFFELFKIVMWFNPLIHFYQKRITVLHEFISDAEVVKESDKKTYFNSLLSQTFNVENISFTNQFYKPSLIKKRIAMITKNQSHKLKQLKYLVLVPLLGGMLLYSSCESEKVESGAEGVNEISTKIEVAKPHKQARTIYQNSNNGGVRTMEEIDSNSYFDMIHILGEEEPNLKINTISYDDLSFAEKEEFNQLSERFGKNSRVRKSKFSLGQLNNGRKIVINKIVYTGNVAEVDKEYYKSAENVPFAIIEETPTFSFCSGDNLEKKKCFSMEINKHVAINFNTDLAQNLDLKPGEKKIYVQFKILKSGEIEIVGARAPHEDLEKEAKRVVKLLPKMTPGKHNGKEVNVTYMLPISFNVKGDVDPAKEYSKENKVPNMAVGIKIK